MGKWVVCWLSVDTTHVYNLVHNRISPLSTGLKLSWSISRPMQLGVRHLKHLAYITERNFLIRPKQTFNINRYN